MRFLKNKYLLPAALAGILIGYMASEHIVPKYFHPTAETKLNPQDIIAAIGAQPNYYRQTAAGNYLAGQFAQNRKDWDKANDYLSRVLNKDEENIELKKHAMVLAMAAGDVSRAITLAKEIKEFESDNILSVLFTALKEFKSENYTQAIEVLENAPQGNAAAFIIPILKLWAETSQGELNTADLPDSSFYAYHVLLIGDYLNQQDKAMEYALRAFSMQDLDIRDIEKTADVMMVYGKPDDALQLYKAIIERGFENESIIQKIDRLENKKPIDDLLTPHNIQSAKDGAALVFFDMANVLLRELSDDSATIFAQMALYLNPDIEESHMLIGNILARHERLDDAILRFKKIKDDSPFYVRAQRMVADLYSNQEKNGEAIEILTKLYEDHDNVNALIQAGDIYRIQEDYAKSITLYSKIIDKWEKVPEQYWHVLYARGMAYERMKEFEKSEEDLLAALEYRPDHPYILNYLGYSWADQGVNLEKSLEMLTKAHNTKPDDGFIADSLGWVYYKMGEYDMAIPYLERAVELMPYDATLNDHLGDAYWRIGRNTEAKFQWERAVNYSDENEADLKTDIEAKLVNGLPDKSADEESMLSEVIPDDNDV